MTDDDVLALVRFIAIKYEAASAEAPPTVIRQMFVALLCATVALVPVSPVVVENDVCPVNAFVFARIPKRLILTLRSLSVAPALAS